MNIKNHKYIAFAILTVITLVGSQTAFAADDNQNKETPRMGMMGGNVENRLMMKSGIFGVVSSVNGNTVVVDGKTGLGSKSATTTYSVDLSKAKIYKNNATTTVSSILVGDKVTVQGTVTGNSVVATVFLDGVRGRGMGNMKMNDSKMPMFAGNGEPVVAGTVSAVNGNSLSITNKSNVNYTVDVTSAKITQGSNTITVANVVVGDSVFVQGTVNGNAVVATSVIDSAKGGMGMMNGYNNKSENNPSTKKGFFGGIGNWFSRMFGF